jgi:ribosomal protein L29
VSKLSERRREIHAMDMTVAQEELKRLRRKLFDLRLQQERGEVKNNREFPQTKADIARLMHHLSELNHAAELEASGALADTEAENETAGETTAPATTSEAEA